MKIKLDPETIETIFNEMMFDAQSTLDMHPVFVGDLDREASFLNLLSDSFEEIHDNFADEEGERAGQNWQKDTMYRPLIDMAASCLLWALWLRQRRPGPPAARQLRFIFEAPNRVM